MIESTPWGRLEYDFPPTPSITKFMCLHLNSHRPIFPSMYFLHILSSLLLPHDQLLIYRHQGRISCHVCHLVPCGRSCSSSYLAFGTQYHKFLCSPAKYLTVCSSGLLIYKEIKEGICWCGLCFSFVFSSLQKLPSRHFTRISQRCGRF
jgi:hypothetical protein